MGRGRGGKAGGRAHGGKCNSLNQKMRAARSAAEVLALVKAEGAGSLSLIDSSTAVHCLARHQRPGGGNSGGAQQGDGDTAAALMRHVAAQTIPGLRNQRTVLTLLWAVAKLLSQDSAATASLPPSALEALGRKGLEALTTADGRGVATAAWSIVHLRKTAPALASPDATAQIETAVSRLLLAKQQQSTPAPFDGQGLANVAWALGALGCRDRALLTQLGEAALLQLADFTSQGLQVNFVLK